MREEDLKNIWTNSSQTAPIAIETAQLMQELNTRLGRIRKVIRIRDNREISASVIGILIFLYLLFEIPFPITKVACAMSIVWFGYVIAKLRKSKIQPLPSHMEFSIKRQLEHQQAAMEQQAHLLNSAAYWYAIPPFIINCIFLFGLGNPADYDWTNSLAESFLPLSATLKIVTVVGSAVFYAFIILINKRAVIKDINPILENLKSVKNQLEVDKQN